MTESQPPITSYSASFAIDGGKIKAIRESKKLTQLYIATCLEITVDTVSRWENGRSPNIKLENAEKLAEVLEISLSEIESSPPPEKEPEYAVQEPLPLPSKSYLKLLWLLIPIAILIFVLAMNRLVPFNQTTGEVTASRLLPKHASPKQPFPVVIKVQGSSEQPISFILTENLPPNCQGMKGEPPRLSLNNQKGTIKWLSNTEDEEALYFAYLAQTDTDLAEGQTLSFNGDIMVKGGPTSKQTITGSNIIQITHFHWADANKDHIIDDEEILAIYNSFEILQDLGVDIDEIRRIWASKGYRWDKDDNKFTVVP